MMAIEYDPNQLNVDAFCGIVDVSNGSVSSFIMTDEDTLNVKHRIEGVLTIGHNISVLV